MPGEDHLRSEDHQKPPDQVVLKTTGKPPENHLNAARSTWVGIANSTRQKFQLEVLIEVNHTQGKGKKSKFWNLYAEA